MTAATLGPVARQSSRAALQARLAANEVGKGLRLAWRRRSMAVVGLIMNALLYLGINFFIGGGHIVEELMVLTLPALLAVVIASTTAVEGSGGIAEEINGGTLEQMQMSPAAPQLQALCRVTALMIEGLAIAAVLGVGFVVAFDLPYDLNLYAAVPAVLIVADAFGYGLLITALTVRVASIGAITHVFNMVIMFFGGMIVPIAVFPGALETAAQFIPTALGVQALNSTLTDGSLSAAWSHGTLPWLLVHTGVLLALGLVVYVVNIRRARLEGGLSPR